MRHFSPALKRLLIAQVPADFADWLDYVAIAAMLAYVWEVPPLAFALMAVAMGAPTLLIGPLVAGRVDQTDLKTVMIVANLGRAIATACLALAPGWGALLALVAIRTAVDSAYTPAKQAAIQAASSEEHLTQANQISQAINQISKVLAPTVGGALVAVMAPQSVFLANAMLSLLAAVLLIGFPAALRAPADPEGTFAGLRNALGVIRARSQLRFALLAMAMLIGATFLFDTLIPPHLKALGFDRQIVGFTVSATGVGMLLGALTPMRETPTHMRWELGVGGLTASALLLLLGMAEIRSVPLGLATLIAIFVGFGVLSARIFIPLRVMLQRETPPQHMARVAALSESANTAALLLPPFVGAAIAQSSSTGWSFVAAAAVFAAMAPMLWRMAR